MSALTKIRRLLGDAGHSQSGTTDRVVSIIAENAALKRQINAVLRLARKQDVEADTPADAVRMLCMGGTSRPAAKKPAKKPPARAKKAGAKARPRPPMMRGKKKWTRAKALADVIEKSGLSKTQLVPCHSEARWGWKEKR